MLNEPDGQCGGSGLMSLPVDSTNTADFSAPLTAADDFRQTVAEFRAATSVELGLNLPSTSEPITEVFNQIIQRLSQNNIFDRWSFRFESPCNDLLREDRRSHSGRPIQQVADTRLY